MLKFQAQVYRINDIVGWHDRRELRLAPEFQRRRVWSPRGKSFLIDSIVRGMPLPQFFVREIVLPKEKRTVREVVDGQQRLSAILGYVAGEFTILPMHNSEHAGVKYDELPEEMQTAFLSFPLSVNILQGTDDADVLEIFNRLNSYSVPLNTIEKLNAQYVGVFKKSVADLAKDHLAYWKRNKILSAQAIARMKDIEFTCELLAAMLYGLQNQKKVISTMYDEFDDAFPQFEAFLHVRFNDTLQLCERIVGGDVSSTAFQRTSLFYSLFCAVYDAHYRFQSTESSIVIPLSEGGLIESQERLIKLSEAMHQEEWPPSLSVEDRRLYDEFYEATRQSTDKLPQRRARHEILKTMLAPAFS